MFDIRAARWRKSTRSGVNGNCVEVADNLDSVVLVRDTKDRSGPTLKIDPSRWTGFLDGVKAGEFDLR